MVRICLAHEIRRMAYLQCYICLRPFFKLISFLFTGVATSRSSTSSERLRKTRNCPNTQLWERVQPSGQPHDDTAGGTAY
jgi:hypothetical protein